jgi:hypothetical protein
VKGCSSWNDFANHAPFAMTKQRSTDCAAFLTVVADKYHSVTTSAIRTADPNHLVLGYRYYGIQQAVLLSAAKSVHWISISEKIRFEICTQNRTRSRRHVDVIDYHAYSENAPISELIEIHELTGLPVMVSEFGYRASDSGASTAHQHTSAVTTVVVDPSIGLNDRRTECVAAPRWMTVDVCVGKLIMCCSDHIVVQRAGLLNTVGAGPVYATQMERTAGYKRFATQLLALPFLQVQRQPYRSRAV